jgi:hypothetical protein
VQLRLQLTQEAQLQVWSEKAYTCSIVATLLWWHRPFKQEQKRRWPVDRFTLKGGKDELSLATYVQRTISLGLLEEASSQRGLAGAFAVEASVKLRTLALQ